MQKLVFDAGSTKTDVGVISKAKQIVIQLSGLNPNLMEEEEMLQVLAELSGYSPETIHYFGAGLGSERSFLSMQEVLKQQFPKSKISIQNDVIGAALAVGQGKACFAGILGTGSNFCYYDGSTSFFHDRSVGYLAGDEGSGNGIGKQLLRDFYYGRMPNELAQQLKAAGWKKESLVSSLYGSKMPNQVLAGLVKTAIPIWKTDYMSNLVKSEFRKFFEYQVLSVTKQVNTIGLVGSIAYFFQEEVRLVGEEFHIQVESIYQKPIEGLIKYFQDS